MIYGVRARGSGPHNSVYVDMNMEQGNAAVILPTIIAGTVFQVDLCVALLVLSC